MVKRRTVRSKEAMTIPHLRRAFDHMESFTQSLVHSGKSEAEQRKAFQTEWKRTFHRDIQAKAVDTYLSFSSKKHKKSGTRKGKKQRGGQMPPLGGAPLDYTTRPGVYGPYGEFPAYVSSGFAFYNDINKDSQTEGCGVKDITPDLSVITRTYPPQKGGKQTRRRKTQRGGFPTISEFAQALNFRPLLATNPTTAAHDAMMTFKGEPPSTLPGPNTGNPPYISQSPMTYSALATPINRDLISAFPTGTR